jgi:3-oxocholest-4-en-26-oate---CoA ligase
MIRTAGQSRSDRGCRSRRPFAYSEARRPTDLPARLRPTPDTKVFGEDGTEIAPGSDRIGMLAYSGPMPVGYFKDADRTASV